MIKTGKEGCCTFEIDQDAHKGILCYNYKSYMNDFSVSVQLFLGLTMKPDWVMGIMNTNGYKSY